MVQSEGNGVNLAKFGFTSDANRLHMRVARITKMLDTRKRLLETQ